MEWKTNCLMDTITLTHKELEDIIDRTAKKTLIQAGVIKDTVSERHAKRTLGMKRFRIAVKSGQLRAVKAGDSVRFSHYDLLNIKNNM